MRSAEREHVGVYSILHTTYIYWVAFMVHSHDYEILLMQRYLSWLNEQLLSVGKHVENISESLADGVLMIQALVVSASYDTFAVQCSIACMHNRFLCIYSASWSACYTVPCFSLFQLSLACFWKEATQVQSSPKGEATPPGQLEDGP